jgi:hypothetical protein
MSAKMPNEYETGCTKFPQIQPHPAAINMIAATCRIKIEYSVFVFIVNTAFLCFHEYRFMLIFLNSCVSELTADSSNIRVWKLRG